MSARLDKLGAEWDRALKKAAEWAAKAKELERKYKELENTEIHDLVHAAELTPDQLAEVLRMLKAGALPSPELLPDTAENTNTEEEIADEDE